MISAQSFQAQLDSYKNELQDFKEKESSEKKLFEVKLEGKEQRRKLKKQVSDEKNGVTKTGKGAASSSHAKNGHESGEYAVVAAMALAMKGGLDVMGSKAQNLQNQNNEIAEQQTKLNQLNEQLDDLKNLSPQDALVKSQELNAQINATNNQTSIIGTDTNEQVMDLKFFSSINNTMGGEGQFVINLLGKEGT